MFIEIGMTCVMYGITHLDQRKWTLILTSVKCYLLSHQWIRSKIAKRWLRLVNLKFFIFIPIKYSEIRVYRRWCLKNMDSPVLMWPSKPFWPFTHRDCWRESWSILVTVLLTFAQCTKVSPCLIWLDVLILLAETLPDIWSRFFFPLNIF